MKKIRECIPIKTLKWNQDSITTETNKEEPDINQNFIVLIIKKKKFRTVYHKVMIVGNFFILLKQVKFLDWKSILKKPYFLNKKAAINTMMIKNNSESDLQI